MGKPSLEDLFVGLVLTSSELRLRKITESKRTRRELCNPRRREKHQLQRTHGLSGRQIRRGRKAAARQLARRGEPPPRPIPPPTPGSSGSPR